MQPSPLPTPVHASALTRQGQACNLGSITMGSLGDALQVQELKRMDPHRLFCFLRRPQHAGKEVRAGMLEESTICLMAPCVGLVWE